jgi:gliding motility-associated protein GldE
LLNIFSALPNLSVLLTIDLSFAFSLLLISILILLSALFSGAEVAFFSISKDTASELGQSKDVTDKRVYTLLTKPKSLLATILIANNFVNIAIVILSTFVLTDVLHNISTPWLKFLIEVVLVTGILLLFGEIIPKIYATKNAISFARKTSALLYFSKILFKPLAQILVASTNFIDKKIKRKGPEISVDELSHALEIANDINESDEEHKILKSIISFGDISVKQVMTARVDVVAIEYNTKYSDVLKIIEESGFSRIPVYKGTFDTVVGILYIKDLLPHIDKNNNFKWQKLLRTPYFVPESKKLDDLLKSFQNRKIHIAIVVDEYGGTSGIITLEDVLEEIVGEISDEFDDDEYVYSKLDDNNYVFEAKIPLNDLYRILKLEDEKPFDEVKGDADTLGGLVIEIAGKIPQKNERIVYENFVFTIESADKRRIKRIKLTIKKPINQEGPNDIKALEQ